MHKKSIINGVLISFIVIAIAGCALFVIFSSDLSRIHQAIENDYDLVNHIDADTFTNMPAEKVIVFDVREPEEFAVSHLPGAILVDPSISEVQFIELHSSKLEGKTAVFYCSVGRRSSDLANRVADIVMDETEHKPVNLIGGVFQWNNENRELISPSGEITNAIHPYNAYWGRLIKNEHNIQYSLVPTTK